uniref:DNA-directed RNA polymerase I subunit RPA34 n=1 Tax=Euleptes europaea TaxID=460621 RepID=UPI00254084AD|nr:DNA-directed RNA polymerase I subunit RPA34 [Euleptes europaea]
MQQPQEKPEAAAARAAHVGMESPEGPLRFTCPSDFSAHPVCPGFPFSPDTLQGPSKELWLIRAPDSFSPESLDGHSVPLLCSRTLTVTQPHRKKICVQTTLEHLAGAQLLVPSGHRGHLTCSLPFSNSLSICERYGDPSDNQPLSPVVARTAPESLKQRLLSFEYHPERGPLPGAVEELPKKKRKMAKNHRLGKEDPEEELALLGMPLWPATGGGKAEAAQQHEWDGAAPLANGSQPISAAVAQDGLLSCEAEAASPGSKKKKRKKRKEDRELKKMGGEAEAGRQHEEEGAASWAVGSLPEVQPNSEFAQDGLLSGEVEAAGPRSKKRKKKREDREVKDEVEAGATPSHKENGSTPWAIGFQPSSEPIAQDGLFSGKAEDPTPISKKKKKKKRKEDREVKGETEAEASCPLEENGTTPWAITPQPSTEPIAQDGLLSGKAEGPGPISIKKKKRKKDREVKDKIEGEGLLDLSSCQGGGSEPHAGEDSLPGMEEVTQCTHKGNRKEKAAAAEAASNEEETAGVLWDFSSPGATPAGRLVAQEEPGVGNSSHKAKKKRKKEKLEEGAQELGGRPTPPEVEGWAQLGTPLGAGGGQEAEPGVEELSQRPKKKKHHRQEAAKQGLARVTEQGHS